MDSLTKLRNMEATMLKQLSKNRSLQHTAEAKLLKKNRATQLKARKRIWAVFIDDPSYMNGHGGYRFHLKTESAKLADKYRNREGYKVVEQGIE